MRPDGFVGRAFAHCFASDLGIPDRLTNWKDDDILTALARRGEDTVGDLILGEESVTRYISKTREQEVPVDVTDYPALADVAISGDAPGSSTGGEQQKFSALIQRDGKPTRILVKFSPLLSTTQGQRWSDLLVCEHIALTVISRMGVTAARSAIYQLGGRTFLEVERFDRTGTFGRSPINSLSVVDAKFAGVGSNWAEAADVLFVAKRITMEESRNLQRIDYFGSLIANTDRHFGNISLIPVNDERTAFRLAPVYDMLPMFYRPKEGEELSSRVYQPLVSGIWPEVYEYVQMFWSEAAKDLRVSEPFRNLCRKNGEQLSILARGPRIIR